MGADCGSLVTFNPRTNAAWDDYAINGETSQNQYRSYLRKGQELVIAIAGPFSVPLASQSAAQRAEGAQTAM